MKVDIVTSDYIKIYYTGKFQDFTARYIINHNFTSFAIADNQKVLFILTGRAIPTGDLGRTVLFRTATEICDMLNVEEILPSLLAKDVITDRDSQTIRARHKSEGNWRAAVKLLDCLPNKHPHWFKQLLAALEESKHDRLAQLLTFKGHILYT